MNIEIVAFITGMVTGWFIYIMILEPILDAIYNHFVNKIRRVED